MSLIKKSDVKNHFSKRSGNSVYPFGLKRPEKAANPEKQGNVVDISISPSHPISSEAVPNAQVGGSIGVPADEGRSNKTPW